MNTLTQKLASNITHILYMGKKTKRKSGNVGAGARGIGGETENQRRKM